MYTTEVVARDMTFLGGRGNASPGAERGGGGGGSRQDNSMSNFDYGPPPISDDDVPF